MENLAQHDEWILRFFSGELSAKEEIEFQEWINRDATNRKYVAAFYAVWNMSQLKHSADKLDIEKAWLELSEKVSAPKIIAVGANPDEAENINRKSTPIFRLWKKIAVAAAVVIVIVMGFVFKDVNRKTTESPELVQTNRSTEKEKTEQLHHEVNNSGKTRTVNLSDGTAVQLYDKSELAYYEHFAPDKRAISLTGRAYFKVAKNPGKPFVVTTKMLTTTALGTEFEARAFKNEQRIVVRLYEGKVVVSSPTLKSWKKDVYLAPGEEVVYLLDKDLVQVNRFLKEPTQKMEEGMPSLPFDTKGSWIMFNNQSLEQVFEQLQELYSTQIVYSKKDIAKMYFIGKFKKEESLETILKRICLVNGLKVRFEGDQYFINR